MLDRIVPVRKMVIDKKPKRNTPLPIGEGFPFSKSKNKIIQKSINSFQGISKFQKVDELLMPHNEGQNKVGKILEMDFHAADEISIVVGYSSLDRILRVIHDKKKTQSMRILFGNEPSIGSLTQIKSSPKQLSEEVKRFWLEERNISLSHSFVLLDAYKKIENGDVSVAINAAVKPLHAKIFQTDDIAVVGSSNFSNSGLSTQREFNGRYSKAEDRERYNITSYFVEGCFSESEDYREELLELLRQLIRKTTWQEALACACWDMLDGMDSDELLKLFKLDEKSLWPHQRQAIAQGLSILREQGSVLVADATGSGKTKTGLWLMTAADAMIKNSQDNNPLSPDPILVVPSSVQKEWRREVRREIGRTPDVVGHGQISYNYEPDSEGSEILERLTDTTVVLVDEAHNFYNNKSNRTMRLRAHGAQSSILLTATPINREFDDLIQLIELLSQDDFDEELERNMKNLRTRVYSKNKDERKKARIQAASLVRNFTVRRTRFDLNRIAQIHPREYLQDGRKIPGFPSRHQHHYPINVTEDDKRILKEIAKICDGIIGLAYLPKEIMMTAEQQSRDISEESIVKQNIMLARAAAKYRIWSTLSSSRAAAFEHVTGTKESMREYSLDDFKSTLSMIPKKLGQRKIPKWNLSEETKESPITPDWLIDERLFNDSLNKEKKSYMAISNLICKMGDSIEKSRADLLVDHYNKGDKTLAFDWHLISLHTMRDLLINRGIPEDRIFLFDSKNKSDAEKHFSLNSDTLPSIGLCSDSLNEGINLQGANVMINLDRPTTIRRFEQRMGRVDRMNSRYDEITIQIPIIPEDISSHMNDHLTERLQLVREVLGGNDIDEKETGLSVYDEEFTDEESTSNFEIEDAFSPIRNLIGQQGLISNEEYQHYGMPNTRARADISVLKSKKPWCFFALRSAWNSSLKWALIYPSNGITKMTTDLKEICQFLSSNLSDDLESPADDERAERYVNEYFRILENHRDKLLPNRYRNSLKLGMKHFAKTKSRFIRSDPEKHERYKKIQIQFGEGIKDNSIRQGENLEMFSVDKSALADAWLTKTKQVKRKALKETDGRSTTKTRKEMFLKMLDKSPISIEDAEEMIANLPLQQPIDEEVRIVIAGIPS